MSVVPGGVAAALRGAAAAGGTLAATTVGPARPVHVRTRGRRRGRALVSYLTTPLRERGPSSHSQAWEARQVVRTWLELGFDVDAIDYRDRTFRPRGSYDVAVDVRRNLERLAGGLGEGCVRIAHLDSTHLLVAAAAEYRRLAALRDRRGVVLGPRRVERLNHLIEHAHAATLLGNDVTAATWAYARRPLHQLPVSAPAVFAHPRGRDVEDVRRRWLWLGSGGMVHKGLDLVLEAFAGAPELELVVCGPVDAEPDFAAAYERELRGTASIRTLGWVDVTSPQFAELAASCVGLVYPTCAEGQAGSVVAALAAGLVPVVTPQAGVDVGADVGRVLAADPTVEDVRAAVRAVSDLPAAPLAQMAAAAWEQARTAHSRSAFASRYRAAVVEILSAQS